MANIVDVELGKVDTVCHAIKNFLDSGEKEENRPIIYMAPRKLRDLRPSSFDPRVVSIGPLHRKDKNVQGFEGKKATYMHGLLHRLESPPDQTLKACVQTVHASIDRIRACYAAGNMDYEDVELLKMIVVDSCFIIELIHRWPPTSSMKGDPILGDMSLTFDIVQDLVLLENQVPFFVLQDIFQCTILKLEPAAKLTELVLKFLEGVNPFQTKLVEADTSSDHILGLLQKSYHPPDARTSGDLSSTYHSVVELDMAGVNFSPNQDPNWVLAMEFKPPRFACFCWPWGKPTLTMPVLIIHDFTESILRNLIAYEQSSPQVPNYITSYIMAIDVLVNTADDIGQIVESKVLVNDLGSNKEAANLINSLGKEVIFVGFSYSEQWKKLDRYYDDCWNKHIARLRRTYFSSPWNFIALLAGIILFALTVVQTFFTVHPP